FTLLDAHQSGLLEEAIAEESLTEFISAGDRAVTELAASVGRLSLVRGLIDIYRSMRNQGLTLAMLRVEIEKSHKTVEDYQHVVEQLRLKMSEFLRMGGLSPATDEKRAEVGRRWPQLREFLLSVTDTTPPADFSEAVLAFRDVPRPSASGKLKDVIKDLNELIWEKNFAASVPRTFFDLHAKRYAAELIKVV